MMSRRWWTVYWWPRAMKAGRDTEPVALSSSRSRQATVLNSSLSTLCAPYIQDKLHLPLDICVLDVTMMDDPGWAQFSLPLVEMLCEAGASLNLNNEEQETALHVAAARGHIECMRCLLESQEGQAVIDSQDRRGENTM